jgi:hypothetical protein
MVRVRFVVLILLLAVTSPLAAKDKKKDKGLPKFIVDGRYVYVTNEAGYDRLTVGTVQDASAERAVRDGLMRWGRYTVVYSPQQADFIIGIRAARNSNSPGVKVGRRPDGSTVWAPGVGSEIGPPDDMLSVYSPTNGTNSAAFWRRTKKYGLSGPLPLLQAFRKDVEESAKQQQQQAGP